LSSDYSVSEHQVIWDLGTVSSGERGTLTALVLPEDEALLHTPVVNQAYLDFTSYDNFSATVSFTSTVVPPELAIRYPDGSVPSDPLLVCDSEVVTMTAASNRSGPLSYAWDFGDGATASVAVVTHSWSYGDYTAAVTTTNAFNWVETDSLAVDAGHAPEANFTYDTPVNLGQDAVFSDLTTFEPTTWSWDFGDGVGTSDQPNPTYNYSNPGVYTVTLSVGNRCGTDVYVGMVEVMIPVYLPFVAKSSAATGVQR
jgi:PKD repeat protein